MAPPKANKSNGNFLAGVFLFAICGIILLVMEEEIPNITDTSTSIPIRYIGATILFACSLLFLWLFFTRQNSR